MTTETHNRRTFLKNATLGGVALSLPISVWSGPTGVDKGKRVGIIGLDTSHSTAFTKALNAAEENPAYAGYTVVAAYPYGSKDIESSTKRIPGYIDEVK